MTMHIKFKRCSIYTTHIHTHTHMYVHTYIEYLSVQCAGTIVYLYLIEQLLWLALSMPKPQTDCVHSGTRLKCTLLAGARTFCLRYVSIRLNCREIIELNNSITRLSHSSCEGVTDHDSRLNQRAPEFASCWQPYSKYSIYTLMHLYIYTCVHTVYCIYVCMFSPNRLLQRTIYGCSSINKSGPG